MSYSVVLACPILNADAQVQELLDNLNIHVVYSVEYHASLSDAQFNELSRRVNNSNTHPDYPTYTAELKRRQNGPDIITHQAWIENGRVVRINTDNTSDALYYDVVSAPDKAWSISDSQLSVVSSDGSGAANAPDITMATAESELVLSYFMTDGLHLRSNLPIGEWGTMPDGQMVASSEGLQLTHTQTATEAVVEVTQAMMAPEEVGLRWVFSDWNEFAPLPEPIPTTLEEYTAQGMLDRRFIIQSIESVNPEVIDAMTAFPELDGVDPVRGPYTFGSIYDYRQNEPRITAKSGDGTITVMESDLPHTKRYQLIRSIGWVTAAAITAGLIIVRVQRNSGKA